MVDVVVDDEHGLEAIGDVYQSKVVIERAALRIPTALALLRRIQYSSCPHDLAEYLPHIIGYNRETWEPYAQIVLANPESYSEILEPFTVQYWLVRVRERIYRGDFGRAWDELRKAYRGFDPKPSEPFQIITPGEITKLAAPVTCIMVLLHGLHQAMYDKGLVQAVLLEPVSFNDLVGPEYKVNPSHWDKRRRLFPGEVFVREFMDRSKVYAAGQMAYYIAKHLSSERNEKRKRKTAKAMSK